MSEAYSVDVGSMSTMRRDNSAGTGSASVTVHGSSLGLVGMTAMVRSGQTGREGTEWESETSVRCLAGHGGQGTRRVTMTAGERSGSMSEAYSVDVGSMSTMRRDNSAGTEWESETSVRCLAAPSASGSRRVTMTAGERSGT